MPKAESLPPIFGAGNAAEQGCHCLPDMGAVLAGAPHPTEKEIRRSEKPCAGAACME